MGDYYSVRLWQLKPGSTGSDLEQLIATGFLEMQQWIPGMKHLSLVQLEGDSSGSYLMLATFANYESYAYWRQVEEEAPDYWERFASVQMHWNGLSTLVAEYTGKAVVDTDVESVVPRTNL